MPPKPRILIAEDEPRIASFIVRGLRKEGYVTTVVDQGDRVLDLALTDKFDLLLLDIGLPFKTGWEILKDLQQHNSPLKVIIITAQATVCDDLQLLNQAIKNNVLECLIKPFRFQTLLHCITAHFSL